MTRALITGITGMVGSHLADYLFKETNWQIHGLLRWRSPMDNLQQHADHINQRHRMFLHYGDLRDELSIRVATKNIRPDYVFHLAAQSYPHTSFTSPCDTLDTNVQGTLRVLEALREYAPEACTHVCSSSEVYGRTKKVPIAEDASFHPASPYAISKVGTDLVAQHYAEAYGMNIQVTRMFTHTGPRRGDVFAESSFAKQVAMIEAGMIPPAIKHGNLDSMRTIADVRDAVRAYYMLLTVNPQPGAVFNIGGSRSLTVRDILLHLVSLNETRDGHIELQQDAARMRPIDADNQIPDCTKFKGVTGWEPTIPFEQTMRDLLNYWREKVKQGVPLQR